MVTTALPGKPPAKPERTRGTKAQIGATGPVRGIGIVAVWVLVVFNLGVFAWVLLTSLREHRDIFATPWGLPVIPAWENFRTALLEGEFGIAALNTAVMTIGGSVTLVVLCAPAAFVLARSTRKISGTMMATFAVGIGLPVQVIIIPLFVLLEKFALVDTLFGLYLALVGAGIPFTVILLAGFMRSLPVELEEAAALDGCSALRSFWQIMLPLARSGIITVLILNAISIWNETFLALVLIQDTEKQVLPVALLNFIARQQFNGSDYGGLFAGVVVLVLPMVLLYLWLGSRIIEGMTLGASK
ncbi:carbohydrate ABC transporter permease [Zhihengliuella halotolerans]|uniref:Carbohydrate ABC transporter membrane protein 2 (CUT1 family) n=1 Tax=Zhihengliuella halotolerans TaxID=370736 RepID=A0A4Q8AGK6_9MICC|nr:carbohydrate ABC transporter permease [Zhihengliuella halotolerans]RZU62885.1 carbohydrate ABC transporter membrane protein 2 (CUT1 family) [Zhihengliuella halotolerans]